MLDQTLVAMIDEACTKPIDQSDHPIRRPQQQGSSIRSDRSAIETTHNFAASDGCKSEQVCATLCLHRGDPGIEQKSFSHNNFC